MSEERLRVIFSHLHGRPELRAPQAAHAGQLRAAPAAHAGQFRAAPAAHAGQLRAAAAALFRSTTPSTFCIMIYIRLFFNFLKFVKLFLLFLIFHTAFLPFLINISIKNSQIFTLVIIAGSLVYVTMCVFISNLLLYVVITDKVGVAQRRAESFPSDVRALLQSNRIGHVCLFNGRGICHSYGPV